MGRGCSVLGGIWSLLTRQQVDGCSSQLDLLAMEVKMLRRELARHSITNEKGIADSFVYSSGEGWRVVGLVGCLAVRGWLWARARP